MKYFRIKFMKNHAYTLQGTVGFHYDNYLEVGGPVDLEFWFFFFGVVLEIGPDFEGNNE